MTGDGVSGLQADGLLLKGQVGRGVFIKAEEKLHGILEGVVVGFGLGTPEGEGDRGFFGDEVQEGGRETPAQKTGAV